VALTSLTPSTTYYVKAYATNAAGTAFGAKISFTTFSSIPAVLTTAVTFVASDKARCAGNVIYEGDAAIIERGVCWSTSPGPTTANDYAISGSGTGAFTSELNGLPGNTTYYVRAFAINALGTGYGNEISFRTSSNDYTGSLTDIRDNKMYDWVKIGTQVWMADNMALLPSVSPSSGGSITAPYYYVYGYQGESVDGAKNESNYATYGVLYNWLAAMRGAPGSNQNPSGVQGICPDGWHMPSDAEWLELREYLGGYDVAGGKLKESGYAHWSSPNTGADNSSGFTALPGGFRMDDGKFTGIGLGGIWWTSWESGMSIARRYYIGYDQAGIFWNDNTMDNGYSVRCVMDE
jgi:uncharacterized protein (TIGR02145 family)